MSQTEKTTTIDVASVAKLARLSLSEAEMEAMSKEMAAIVEFADKLSEVDCSDMPITAHVVPLENVMREDVPMAGAERDALLAGAPTKADGYFTVPRVVES